MVSQIPGDDAVPAAAPIGTPAATVASSATYAAASPATYVAASSVCAISAPAPARVHVPAPAAQGDVIDLTLTPVVRTHMSAHLSALYVCFPCAFFSQAVRQPVCVPLCMRVENVFLCRCVRLCEVMRVPVYAQDACACARIVGREKTVQACACACLFTIYVPIPMSESL
jgi:hypothetical protein